MKLELEFQYIVDKYTVLVRLYLGRSMEMTSRYPICGCLGGDFLFIVRRLK